MKLIEADGKRLLRDAGIETPTGVFIDFNSSSPVDLSSFIFPLYLKSQVLQGRRGKRGWIRRCVDANELQQNLTELREILHDIPCAGFLCEPETIHETEWLVSVFIDRLSGKIHASYTKEGGMNVSTATEFPINQPNDITALDVPEIIKQTIQELFEACLKNDAISLEINPLAVLADGRAIALDAKVELDDAAAFRHPEWSTLHLLSESGRALSEREEAYLKRQEQAGHRGTLGRYVELEGDIAMILSGGGASLVAIDALKLAGGNPANYVEMSGNPDPEAVRDAVKIVLSKPGIKAIWIAGSFANFTDIQATVGATLAAVADLGLTVPIVIRRDGPNAAAAKEDALQWATEQGVSIRFDRADVDLDTSAQAVVTAAKAV